MGGKDLVHRADLVLGFCKQAGNLVDQFVGIISLNHLVFIMLVGEYAVSEFGEGGCEGLVFLHQEQVGLQQSFILFYLPLQLFFHCHSNLSVLFIPSYLEISAC